MSWFARTFNAGASRVATPAPRETDAATEPAFGPDLVRAERGSSQNTGFAGILPMRMRGLEPVHRGLAPPGRAQHKSTWLNKKPRTSGVFRSNDLAGVSNVQHNSAALSRPDLVPIWSEIHFEAPRMRP